MGHVEIRNLLATKSFYAMGELATAPDVIGEAVRALHVDAVARFDIGMMKQQVEVLPGDADDNTFTIRVTYTRQEVKEQGDE